MQWVSRSEFAGSTVTTMATSIAILPIFACITVVLLLLL